MQNKVPINGTTGNDTLKGTPYNDTISGKDGKDILYGFKGNDVLFGNTDNFPESIGDADDRASDTLRGGDHGDWLYGDRYDYLLGEGGGDQLRGGRDANGGDGGDYLVGFAHKGVGGLGNDTLETSTEYGNVFLFGQDGNDKLTIAGAYKKNYIGYANGGTGTDEIKIGKSYDTNQFRLEGESGNDAIVGSIGYDTIYGGKDNDFLLGTQVSSGIDGDDLIYGGTGNDTIAGGFGADTLIGGTGKNYFWGEEVNKPMLGSKKSKDADTFVLQDGGIGIISDYVDGVDKIALRGNLSFKDIRITEGTGDYLGSSVITHNGDSIGIVLQVLPRFLDANDFISRAAYSSELE